MVAALEGVQQLFGFHERYVGYRSAWNLLDRQRRLYVSTAGDYAHVTDPQTLLAEKVDGILQAETTSWAKDTTRSAAGVASPIDRTCRARHHQPQLWTRPTRESTVATVWAPCFREGIVYEETRCQSGGSTTPSSVKGR